MQENGFCKGGKGNWYLLILYQNPPLLHIMSLTRNFQHGMIIGTDLALARVEC
jgi:hypothetical protein